MKCNLASPFLFPRYSKATQGWSGSMRRSADPLGGTGDDCHFKDICLIHSLRALGMDVPIDRSGPFRALTDGNAMVAPFGHRLLHVPYSSICVGSYVKWFAGHFVAVEVGGLVQVTDGVLREPPVRAIPDLEHGHLSIWYKLLPCGQAAVPPTICCAMNPTVSHRITLRRRLAELTRARRAVEPMQPHPKLSPDMVASIEQRKHAAIIRQGVHLQRPVPPRGWKEAAADVAPHWSSHEGRLPPLEFLSLLNMHERDARVQFFDSSHTYLVDGVVSLGSVTGLAHSCSMPFDADRIITLMERGSRWPRPGYLRDRIVMRARLVELGCEEACKSLMELLDNNLIDEIRVCMEAKRVMQGGPKKRRLMLESLPMSASEIKAKWALNSQQAARDGTRMHWRFEAWLNRVAVPEDGPEFAAFKNFVSGLDRLVAYRTEWVIFSEKHRLAGCVDFVAMDRNGHLVIFDWKRSKCLADKFSNGFSKMSSPLQHLDDCQGV